MRNPDKLRLIPGAKDLAVHVYRATAHFPQSERFGLTSQLRRAAVSVGSNIAEGAHRQGNRAFLAFLHHSLGSTAELIFQLDLARELGFGAAEELALVEDKAQHMRAMLIRMITALRDKGD